MHLGSEHIKSERLSLRLDPVARKTIEQAVGYTQSSMNGFILSSALERAYKLIEEHEQLHLAGRDSAVFFEAITSPSKPSKVLKNAFTAYEKIDIQSDA